MIMILLEGRNQNYEVFTKHEVYALAKEFSCYTWLKLHCTDLLVE